MGLAPRHDVARQGSARITIAHEMGHLLVDRDHALGVVDMHSGRMPLAVEQRAWAFAAAVMLPAEAAAAIWHQAEPDRTQPGGASVLRRLTQRLGVTTGIAARQLEHGLRGHVPNLGFLLDQIAA
jgi:Zn-dependent peptidase ImmA (M78 family)